MVIAFVVKLFKMPGSCRAYKIPRNQVTAFFSREKELKVCGVYLLLSDSSKGRKVYVGESEPVEKRIKQHLASPPFDWEEAIVFVGNGAGLLWSKGDIKYMEHGIYMKLKSGFGQFPRASQALQFKVGKARRDRAYGDLGCAWKEDTQGEVESLSGFVGRGYSGIDEAPIQESADNRL